MWNGLQCLFCISNAGSALTGWLNTPFWLHKPFIPHLALSMHLCQVWNPFHSPYFKGTADKIMFWSGKWLQTLFSREGKDSEVDLGFLLCAVLWNMDIKGGIWYFKGSQFTNMLWLALEISGKEKSKIENLSLYFAAYTGDEQFWVSGNVLLMAGQKNILLKWKIL